jgi:hypothetical protein
VLVENGDHFTIEVEQRCRAVLDKVQQGSEVIIEREDHRAVIMKQLQANLAS